MHDPLFAAPKTLTFEEHACAAIIGAAADSLAKHAAAHRAAFNLIWKHPSGKTPEQMFAALGNKAARIVIGSAATIDYLTAQYALAGVPYTPPALPFGVSLQINNDGPGGTPGTVTVVRGVVVPE